MSHESKTTIILRETGSSCIARSEGRIVTKKLEKFKKIILDFDRVPNVGQAFSDEIFRVFKERHPKIIIQPINMNDSVQFMVERAQKTIR